MCALYGKTKFFGSWIASASSLGSRSSGRLWAVQAEKVSSFMVFARSGAPFTANVPRSYSRSFLVTSSSWAAIFLVFSMIFSAVLWTAILLTAIDWDLYVSRSCGTNSVSLNTELVPQDLDTYKSQSIAVNKIAVHKTALKIIEKTRKIFSAALWTATPP